MRLPLPGRAIASDQAGMTLVEVMVAMLVLTLVLSALAGVLTASLQSLRGDQSRVTGNAVANDTLEELRRFDWRKVGFSETDDGYVATFEEEDTVTFEDGGRPVPSDPRPTPLEEVTRDGTTYTVRTHITWVEEDGVQQDFVRLVTIVTWQDGGRERTVRHESTRAAEADENFAAIRSVAVDPPYGYLHTPSDEAENGKLNNKLVFDDDGNVIDEEDAGQGAELVVTTRHPVEEVTAILREDYSGDQQGPVTLDPDGSTPATTWTLSRTMTSDWRYRNGDIEFEVTATRDTHSATVVATPDYRMREAVYNAGPAEASGSDGVLCYGTDADGNTIVEVHGADVLTEGSVRGLVTTFDTVEVTWAGQSEPGLADLHTDTRNGLDFSFVLAAGRELPTEAVDSDDHFQMTYHAVRALDDGYQDSDGLYPGRAEAGLGLPVYAEDSTECS